MKLTYKQAVTHRPAFEGPGCREVSNIIISYLALSM